MTSSMHILVREKIRSFLTQFPYEQGSEAKNALPEAKELEFAPNGSCFASIEGENHHIAIRDGTSGDVLITYGGRNDEKTPLRVSYVAFSPKGTFLLAWARPVQDVNVPNLVVYRTKSGEYLGGFHQKTFHKDFWPSVQWSDDESIAVRTVTNTVHFFAGDNFNSPSNKLGVPGVNKCALSRGSAPYTLAVFISGKSGAPGKFAIYTHPDQGGEQLMNRSTFRADAVDFQWNARGSSLLATASTSVDNTGKSYYGQSEVYFMNKRGTICKRIELPQEGPTYDAAWSPTGDHFIVMYGFTPARATLFDDRCEPVFDFGTGSWNTIVFSPHGRYVALAGFGSLAGRVEFWDCLKQAVVGRVELPCTTQYSWSPCSRYFLSATTYPRLRVSNGYKVARIDGKIIHQVNIPDEGNHLYDARFRLGNSKSLPDPLTVTSEMIGGPMQKPTSWNANGSKKGGVYRPPGSRGQAASFSLHDHVEAGKVNRNTFLSGKPKIGQPMVSASGKKIVPGMDPDDVEDKKPSKASLKRKKKKERERLAQLEKEKEPVAELPGFENLAAAEKKVKALTKKLRQIATLKEAQAEGKELKDEQVTKLSSEPKLQAELKAVQDLIDSGKLTA